MGVSQVIMEGVVKPDGTLELLGKLDLPAGRVQVMIQSLRELPKDDPFWQMMQGIWDSRKAAGLTPRSADEVEKERRALRAEVEGELQEAMQHQEKDDLNAKGIV